MAKHWIPAERTLALIAANSFEGAARIALCSRAYDGLIPTRARLLVMGDKASENIDVPKSFWWAKGHEALDQDWSVGDFGTWIDRRIECRAYGVRFDLDGLREMLAAEHAATIARELSVAGSTSWLPAQAARRFMYERLGANPTSAGEMLLDQCRLGFVAARAVLMRRADSGRSDEWTEEEREWDVPGWFWESFTTNGTSSQQWERGIFAGRGPSPNGRCSIKLSYVHFARASLEAMLPLKTPSEPTPGGNGGRPAAAFWDELWCAVWGQVYRGDLKPQRPGDITRAMHAWLAENGREAADSTIRQRARLMYAALEKDAGNP